MMHVVETLRDSSERYPKEYAIKRRKICVIIVNFPLPFKLPIADGVSFVSAYEIANFKLTFHSRRKVIIDDESEEIVLYTLAEIDFSPKNTSFKECDINSKIRSAFKSYFSYLNQFLDAFRAANSCNYIKNITLLDLPKELDVFVGDNWYKYILRQDNNYEVPLQTESLALTGKFMSGWDAYPEAYLVDRFLESAKSYFQSEDFGHSVIELQTSFEIFIRNTFRLILKKNNIDSDAEVERALRLPFKNVIEQHLSKWLKADLKFDSKGPINDWYTRLYIKRNDIVHKGMIYVTGQEAQLAFESYYNARNFIVDCLIREKYLDREGKVNLAELFQNKRDKKIESEFLQNLYSIGFLPKGRKIKEI